MVCSYYNFLRLGRDGYAKVQSATYQVARYLAEQLAAMGPFEILFDANPRRGIPAVTWKLADPDSPYTLFDLADELRSRGWLVPAYTLPPREEHVAVQRIIVRHGLSLDMADLVLDDIRRALSRLTARPAATPPTVRCPASTTMLFPPCPANACILPAPCSAPDSGEAPSGLTAISPIALRGSIGQHPWALRRHDSQGGPSSRPFTGAQLPWMRNPLSGCSGLEPGDRCGRCAGVLLRRLIAPVDRSTEQVRRHRVRIRDRVGVEVLSLASI